MALAKVALVILGLGIGMVRPADHTGFAVRYGPDVMSRVALNRGIEPSQHMAAYTYAENSDMGKLWLHIEGPSEGADFLVVDLPHPKDKRNLISRGVVAEVDYNSGHLICGVNWTGRAKDCEIKVWVIHR